MILAIVFVLILDLKHLLYPSSIQRFINQFGLLGPVAFILIYTIAQVFLIPSTPLSILGGVIFGTLQGSAYAIIGATLGAILAFSIARHMGQDFVSHILSKKYRPLAKFNKKLEVDGFAAVLFFRLPIFPRSITNYLFGLTKTPLWKFVLATIIILLVTMPLLAYFGSSLASLNKVKILSSTILLIMVTIIVSLLKKKDLAKNPKKHIKKARKSKGKKKK